MKKKAFLTSVSIIMTVVMFTLSIPLALWKGSLDKVKELVKKTEVYVQENVTSLTEEKEDPYIVEEITSKRGEKTKEYLLSDGSFMVQQFAEKVHYNDNGEYKEVDNSVIEKTIDDNIVYQNKANSLKINVNKKFKNNKTVAELSEDGYVIKFSFIGEGIREVESEVSEGLNEIRQEKNYRGKKNKQPDRYEFNKSKIKYANIKDSVDIEYEINSNGLKENIIINKKLTEYVFKFKIQVENLWLELQNDGEINAYKEDGEIKFQIPAPFMVDKNGLFNNDVFYQLINLNDGYELIVTADKEWINNTAELPVTIDPIIQNYEQNNRTFITVYKDGTTSTAGDYGYVGQPGGTNTANTYVNFNIVPRESIYTLVSGSVTYYHTTAGINIFRGTNLKYSANVVEPMDIEDITFTNMPTVTEFLRTCGADTNVAVTNQEYTEEFDIKCIKDGRVMFGFLKADGCSNYMNAKLHMTGDHAPSILLTYKLITGVDEDYSIEEISLGDATANVNIATGNLNLNVPLASVNTMGAIGLSSSLIYNSNYNDIINELGYLNVFGNNFKLNLQQYVKYVDGEYYYYDADGSLTIFYENALYGVFLPKDKNLLLEAIGANVEITDPQNNILVFNSGRLVEVTGASEYLLGSIKIEYAVVSGVYSNKVQSIGYYQYNKSIPDYLITFEYGNDDYVDIVKTWKCNSSTNDRTQLAQYSLEYDAYNNLISIKNDNENAYAYKFSYESVTGNPLTAVFSRNYEGMGFVYSSDDYSQVTLAQQRQGVADTASHLLSESTEFDYSNYPLNKVKYYSDNKNTMTKYVRYNELNNVHSEWIIDQKGQINVSSSMPWKRLEATNELTDYTKESYAYEINKNTSIVADTSISANGTLTGTIDSSSGISNSEYYKYALVFSARSLSDLNLTVTIGNISKSFKIDGGNQAFLTVPCGYISSGSFTISNNGSTYSVTISNVSYVTVDYVHALRQFGNSAPYSVTEKEQYSRIGEVTKITYNNQQQEEIVITESKYDTVPETKTSEFLGVSEQTKYQVQDTVEKDGEIIESTLNVTSANGVPLTTISTKGSVSTTTNYTYSDDGMTVTETDERGNAKTTYYGISSGDIRVVKTKQDNRIEEYTYNYFGDVSSVKVYNENYPNNYVLQSTSTYTNGLLSGVSLGSIDYGFGYDSYGKVNGIYNEQNPVITYTYDGADISSKTYANGNVVNYSEDSTQVTYKDSASATTGIDVYNYNKDSKNRLTSTSYVEDGVTKLTYDYGNLDDKDKTYLNITGVSSSMSMVDVYDERDLLTNSAYTFTEGTSTSNIYANYSYDGYGRITQNALGKYKTTYFYDDSDRIQSVSAYKNTALVNLQSYHYKTFTSEETGLNYNSSSRIVSKITNSLSTLQDSLATYNTKGYVTSTTSNGVLSSYQYDELTGRLLSETTNGVTTNFSYDTNNNLTSKTVNGVQTTFNVSANQQLTSITDSNGTKYIEYDAVGNPVKYKVSSLSEESNLTWTQGNKLAGGTINGITFAYEYDANGVRSKAIVNGIEVEYYLDGSRLIAEKRNGNVMIFYYDATGIAGVMYNGIMLYYVKNVLGDVINVIESDGTIVASYNYDAWGNVVGQTGSFADINPFRYRGYYYDSYTGWYYLQTRYYDPSTCRFLSADNPELLGSLSSVPGQLNIYSYCNNNPVMYVDHNGKLAFLLSAIFIGVISLLSGVIMGVKSYNEGNSAGKIVLDFISGFAGGAIVSGVLLTLGGMFACLLASSLSASVMGAFKIVTATGALGFNLGSFIAGVLNTKNKSNFIELPLPIEPPIYNTPITGF